MILNHVQMFINRRRHITIGLRPPNKLLQITYWLHVTFNDFLSMTRDFAFLLHPKYEHNDSLYRRPLPGLLDEKIDENIITFCSILDIFSYATLAQ